jgi:hypothetical protein
MATWAGYLSNIGRVLGVKNTAVTDELKRWSNPLTELTKVFSENQENIAITTFFESRSLHGAIVGILHIFESVRSADSDLGCT